MAKDKIKIVKTQTWYTISKGEFKINVQTNWQGRIDVRPINKYGGNHFMFLNSNPDVVREVAKLILEATKLVEKPLNINSKKGNVQNGKRR